MTAAIGLSNNKCVMGLAGSMCPVRSIDSETKSSFARFRVFLLGRYFCSSN